LPDSTEEPLEESLLGLALAASALVSALTAPVLRRGEDGPLLPQVFSRVAEQVVPPVVGSVDVDALLARIDVNALLARIDMDALLARVDVDALVQRVDVDALLERVDVAAVAERAEIGELVAQSTRDVAGTTLDLARRQLVAVDLLITRVVRRVWRPRPPRPLGPPALAGAPPDADAPVAPAGQVTGRFAGPGSRLTEFAIDIGVIIGLFGLASNVLIFTAQLIAGWETDPGSDLSVGWLAGYLLWAFVYFLVSLSITGRTIGKWLVGVRVVERDGTPLRGRAALVRVLALPLSLLSFGLGLVGIVIGREHRALHDVLAGSVVVYDWGDRPAEMPAPLTRWLQRHGTLDTEGAP
jgi:uncharacterized RDD family membrane protein YckC